MGESTKLAHDDEREQRQFDRFMKGPIYQSHQELLFWVLWGRNCDRNLVVHSPSSRASQGMKPLGVSLFHAVQAMDC